MQLLQQHTDKLNTQVALHQLYQYASKYYDVVNTSRLASSCLFKGVFSHRIKTVLLSSPDHPIARRRPSSPEQTADPPPPTDRRCSWEQGHRPLTPTLTRWDKGRGLQWLKHIKRLSRRDCGWNLKVRGATGRWWPQVAWRGWSHQPSEMFGFLKE